MTTPTKDTKTEVVKSVGRPTTYRKSYPDKAAKLWSRGATDQEVAKALKTTRETLNQWEKRHPEFADAKKQSKAIADQLVERALFQRATGIVLPDCHVSVHEGHVTITALRKHYPPDPVSMIFWLKNRKPDQWREKSEMQIAGTLTGMPENLVQAIQQRAAARAKAKTNGATHQTEHR